MTGVFFPMCKNNHILGYKTRIDGESKDVTATIVDKE